MLRLKNPRNQFQKRTLRVNYSQSKATPMDSTLHASLGTGATFVKPLSTDTVPAPRTADAFTLKNGLVPGTVIIRSAGDTVVVATGQDVATIRPYGLLANFVGGDFDELGDENKVGVWRGVGSEYTILAPAFDDTGLATAYQNATPGNPVKLFAQPSGLLGATAGANRVPVAHLVERVSAQVIRVDLLV